MPASMIQRFLESLAAGAIPSVALLVLAAVLVTFEAWLAPKLRVPVRRAVRWGTLALGLAVAYFLAYRVLWLGDDAYISFRYARNLAEGHGLVFNPGERVEGYTNFLWTVFLGAAGWLGANIPHVGLFGNLAAFGGVLLLTAATARRSSPGGREDGPVLPLAALALAGSGAFAVWGSSGLETMPAAFLVIAGVWAASRSPVLAGLCFTLAAMTRPDHVLLVAAMGLALVVEDLLFGETAAAEGEPSGGRLRAWWRRLDFPRYVRYAAPFVLLYVPYFLWRWWYYGDLFPNTYYAKSGGSSYWQQGWVYASATLLTTGAWLFLPAFLLALAGRPRDRHETRVRVFALLATVLLGGYVVRVGGDFMLNRFFIDLLPPVLVAAEAGLRWRYREAAPRLRIAVAALAVLAVAGPWLPVKLIKPWEKKWHLAAEETFYQLRSVFPISVIGIGDQAAKVKKVFTDRNFFPRLALGSVGVIGYESRLPIVDVFGLTNRAIARKEIRERGRPGHEKMATWDEVLAEGAEVGLDLWGYSPLREWSEASANGLQLAILRFTPEILERLRSYPGARVPDPWVEAPRIAREESRDRVEEALRAYEKLVAPEYREGVLAPLRERLALDAGALRARLAAEPPTAVLLLDAETLLPREEAAEYAARFPARWSFDDGFPEGTEVEGEAFGPGPVRGPLASHRQQPVRGHRGAFLNSYHGGDGTTGKVVLPAFLAGGRVSLRVGGGPDCRRVYAGLEVDGKVVARVCGRKDEVLRTETLDTSLWAGKPARLVLVDQARGGWGHLLVDEVIVEPPSGTTAPAGSGVVPDAASVRERAPLLSPVIDRRPLRRTDRPTGDRTGTPGR
jgi:hypothetical protein